MIRLDKYLTDMGVGSRSEVKKAIQKKLITVNGVNAKTSDLKVDPGKDIVAYHGEEIPYEEFSYYMLNKPQGVVSATSDPKEQTVIDLVPGIHRKDLFPVGRLDKDTEGLLILTNDGAMAHRLLAPGKHVDKEYFVRVEGEITEEDLARLRQGIDIGDEKPTEPAKAELVSAGEISEFLLTIHEGRYHQIKRMAAAIGKPVIYLKRLSMGEIRLDESLKKGDCRRLNEEEMKRLCLKV